MTDRKHGVRRALILAAGMGTRLRPLTTSRPKPLVPVNGVPILHNALASLAAAGIDDVTIVVGYRKEFIYRSCAAFPGLAITYCESTVFDRSGSAYSLWLARDRMDDDLLVLEGDVFFEPALLQRLLSLDSDDSLAAVASWQPAMSGSAATLDADGMVSSIRTGCKSAADSAEPLYKTVNLYLFRHDFLLQGLVPALTDCIEGGGIGNYLEAALADAVARRPGRLRAVDCTDLRWYEIDDAADLAVAEALFAERRPMPDLERAGLGGRT